MPMSMDNEPIKVGDTVGWKEGIEQRGTVREIRGDMIHIDWWDEHNHEDVVVVKTARRCWKEG